jgi:hypothetical protein
VSTCASSLIFKAILSKPPLPEHLSSKAARGQVFSRAEYAAQSLAIAAHRAHISKRSRPSLPPLVLLFSPPHTTLAELLIVLHQPFWLLILVAHAVRSPSLALQSVGRGAQALLRVGSFELTACRLSPDSSFCKQQYVEERLPKDLSRMM